MGVVAVCAQGTTGAQTETLGVIYRTYDRGGWSPAVGALAVANVVVIVVGLVALGALALRTRQRPGQW